ncbi:hypothetical protein AVEN_177188-1 [Araneus ventricosus]|uniref:Uncharacterized protein n=1 Tax=Araneus ventricosus TaxID=182803 RepID=A0A4Y2V8I7_ARAVE|nr:hypothetical protein AVEN_177188-1 [Araneus ventricosus]
MSGLAKAVNYAELGTPNTLQTLVKGLPCPLQPGRILKISVLATRPYAKPQPPSPYPNYVNHCHLSPFVPWKGRFRKYRDWDNVHPSKVYLSPPTSAEVSSKKYRDQFNVDYAELGTDHPIPSNSGEGNISKYLIGPTLLCPTRKRLPYQTLERKVLKAMRLAPACSLPN